MAEETFETFVQRERDASGHSAKRSLLSSRNLKRRSRS